MAPSGHQETFGERTCTAGLGRKAVIQRPPVIGRHISKDAGDLRKPNGIFMKSETSNVFRTLLLAQNVSDPFFIYTAVYCFICKICVDTSGLFGGITAVNHKS